MQVEDLAAEVRPACDFGHAAAVQAVIAGIGVGLEKAAEAGEMRLRVRGGQMARPARHEVEDAAGLRQQVAVEAG